MRAYAVRILLSLVALVAIPLRAQATYDVSGPWLMSIETWQLRLTLTESQGVLTSPDGPGYSGWSGWMGTIDQETGVLHLEAMDQYAEYVCGSGRWTLDATVAPDGRTFVGTLVYAQFLPTCGSFDECVSQTAAVTGTRCGNLQLDEGEECDVGDIADGDCCTSSCVLDPVGAGCTSDGSECTSDLCNSAGTCEHLSVPGPCVEPHGCGSGECSAGACVLTDLAPQGTSCDLDASVCTVDTCNSGNCTAGERMACRPCRLCDDVKGCVEEVESRPCSWLEWGTCYDSPDRVRMSIRSSPRRKLQLIFDDYSQEVPDTFSDYKLCVFVDDGAVTRPLFNAVLRADAQCGGEACWRRKNGQWSRDWVYRDKDRAVDGIYFMRVQEGRVTLKASGRNLSVPAILPTSGAVLPTIIQDTDRCWSHPLAGEVRTSNRFVGVYEP